jgi:membrane-associated phospholipid phosphatase
VRAVLIVPGACPRLAWLAAGWLGLLAGAIAMSVWAAIDDHFPGDIGVGRWIQAHDLLGRDLSQFLRDVGSSSAVATTFVIVVVALIALRYPRVALVALVAASLVAVLGIQRGLKLLVERPRTSILFLEQHGTFDSYSFPSGHAMGSAVVGGLLIYLAWRIPGPLWIRVPVATWGLSVGLLQPWASVSAGVHWPSDTLGGFVWATVVLAPVLFLIQRWAWPRDAQDSSRPPGGGPAGG